MILMTILRVAGVLTAGILFFALLGPFLGAICYIPTRGLHETFAILPFAYIGGLIPAIIAGMLNSIFVLSNHNSANVKNVTNLLVGAFAGSAAMLFMWLLMGPRDFLGFAKFVNSPLIYLGAFSGAICALVLNPWALRKLQSNSALNRTRVANAPRAG
jgi:carbon starvation protein CstA